MCLHDDVSSDNWTGKSRGHPFLDFQVGPVWATRLRPIRVFPSCPPPRHPPYGAAGVVNRPPGMVRRVFFSSFSLPRFAAQGGGRFTWLWLNQLPVCVLFSGTNCPQTRVHPYPRAAASVRCPSTSPVTVHMHADRQRGSYPDPLFGPLPLHQCSYVHMHASSAHRAIRPSRSLTVGTPIADSSWPSACWRFSGSYPFTRANQTGRSTQAI